jgi:predicted ATPase
MCGLLGQTRLLTLTGPGGSGKTRLALVGAFAVGDTFANGATFVDLAPISDPDLVISAVAQALEAREAARQPLLASVQAALQDQHRLLVLDNFEQVLPAAPMVPELLRGAPQLKVLVTSRAPLRLTGEQEYPVPPLEVPTLWPLPTVDQLAQVPAVALFVQRAQATQPAFRLTKANAPRWRSFVCSWMACRWHWSSQLPGSSCCPRQRC